MDWTPYLLGAVIALQVADIATTLHILWNGGRELNPMMAWLFRKLGPAPALVGTKGAFCGVLVWLYAIDAQGLGYGLAFLTALYAGIVIHNLIAIRKMRL